MSSDVSVVFPEKTTKTSQGFAVSISLLVMFFSPFGSNSDQTLVKGDSFQLSRKSLLFPTSAVLYPDSLRMSHIPFFYLSFDTSFCCPSPSAGAWQSFGRKILII